MGNRRSHGRYRRSIGCVLLLAVVSPAFAQSGASGFPEKPLDRSIAGNTQQAAGQLAEINRKLGLILEKIDVMSKNRAPLIVPASADCTADGCDASAKKACEKLGYRNGEAIGRTSASQPSWVCFDDVGP